jgi:hypothetical protein
LNWEGQESSGSILEVGVERAFRGDFGIEVVLEKRDGSFLWIVEGMRDGVEGLGWGGKEIEFGDISGGQT